MNARRFICTLLVAFSFFGARATHIVGGEFTYRYLGDTVEGVAGTLSMYSVSLSIYEDCLNGDMGAIAQDNPAYLEAFENDGTKFDGYFFDTPEHYDSIFYSNAEQVPVNFSNKCVNNVPKTCLLKKTFVRTYYFPHNSTGYIITYQRCCRNCSIQNIEDPCNTGSTFYCTIPAWPMTNSSAVFKNYPPQVICLDNPLDYDHSATDVDGDSLSYKFCVSLNCCGGPGGNSRPIPPPPDQFPPLYYDSVTYVSGYSSPQPLSGFPPVVINPVTGLITGTPDLEGRYLVTVCCSEWRHGVLINTSKREFQFVVAPCTKVVVADIPQYSTDPNTYIVDCSNYTVDFVNTSSGGFAYDWNFGVPGIASDSSSAFEPSYTYPDTGTYLVTLVVNPGTTCPDSISRLVKVYPYFKADFADSGIQCPGDTLDFTDLSSSTLKPINSWKWTFGDGDSSFLENPGHVFSVAGTYNVTLISENVRHCMDTILKQVLVERFKPFAGNDTMIVKGTSVRFDATGGVNYSWSPGLYLDDTSVFNPQGTFPDTGTFNYVVQVASSFGCYGVDTIQVRVVGQSEFFVPDAFSPNGDGKNDVFKPIAVGYKSINYFCVFNRYGQRIYTGNSFEEGWDGTYRGQRQDVGVYFWEISFMDRDGKPGFLKGEVTLVR